MTGEEQAAYKAANPDIPEPRPYTAREFLGDITGVNALLQCGSVLGCIGAAAMMAPIPHFGKAAAVTRAAAKAINLPSWKKV